MVDEGFVMIAGLTYKGMSLESKVVDVGSVMEAGLTGEDMAL